jgi:hypothetical protein
MEVISSLALCLLVVVFYIDTSVLFVCLFVLHRKHFQHKFFFIFRIATTNDELLMRKRDAVKWKTN